MRRWFNRKHKHKWQSKSAHCGPAVTVKWVECQCGKQEARRLTPAGWQQVTWWMSLGMDGLEATQGVLSGDLPYPMVIDGALGIMHLADTREGK